VHVRIPQLILTFPLLFALILALAACGGGNDRLSDAEYFERLTEFDTDADQRFEALEQEETTAGEVKGLFSEVAQDYVDNLNNLEPPNDLEDEHNELVAALDEFEQAVAAIDIDEDAPGEKIFAEIDFVRANTAFCELQKAADDKGIEADVGCDEDTGEQQPDPATLEPVETSGVLIQDFAFDPPHIQVSVGDTVTWTQGADGEPHTATADDETFDTGTLVDEGETGEFTFEEAGEFPYFCEVHPEMLGQVTVVE